MMIWKGLTLELVRTEVFLPKKFEDNEITLPNVPKRSGKWEDQIETVWV